ncbi:hypothetical protein P4562_24100 [Lysinibacillus xylanilyticus]|uniref:hypothetical protein n=1 Tax=Lysinibacillus xylanilyticus TaxID=582475 RepID=UPI002E220FF6|nr:hypothetical protein [Lysinibacillus xylanilyticus]
MKSRLTKVITSLLVFSLVISAFSPTILAKSKADNTNFNEQEVQELAEALEFVFEQAMIEDEFGEAVGLDFEKIEEKYGNSYDLEKVENNIEKGKNEVIITARNAGLDRCIERKIKDYFTAEDFIPTAVISSVIALVMEKEYTSAALKLLKAGAKGNAAGIAASLGSIFFTCLWQESTWP